MMDLLHWKVSLTTALCCVVLILSSSCHYFQKHTEIVYFERNFDLRTSRLGVLVEQNLIKLLTELCHFEEKGGLLCGII
jgi:hypothetical protein